MRGKGQCCVCEKQSQFPRRIGRRNAFGRYVVDTAGAVEVRWSADLIVNPQQAVRPISRTRVPCLRSCVDMPSLTPRTCSRERKHVFSLSGGLSGGTDT